MRRCPNCECAEGALTRFTGRSHICDYCRESLARRGLAWCRACAAPAPNVRHGICRACDNARRQQAHIANREAERAAQRRRYAADPAAFVARVAAWKAANPERSRAHDRKRMRRWRQANPERTRAANARYRARNRERLRELARLTRIRRKLRLLASFRGR